MNKLTLIYCYDAYCGWCYGFSPVIKKIAAQYKNEFHIEVLSGGMMTGEHVMPIERIGPYIQKAYKNVEELTGIQFGEDFLWHVNNPDKSDWVMNSEKPAIALCIFKEYYPDDAILFASDLQYALNYEGRDLDDDEAYRHLLQKYSIPEEAFFEKLKSEAFKEKAHYEFALCRHLQVTSFPQVLIQQNASKFYLIAKGFSDFETVNERIQNVLKELSLSANNG
jgi:putative protein-disulfide isomerase